MAITEKDIKLLWGRAASRCAFPECHIKLSHDKNTAMGSFPLGEQAHIVGEEVNSPRGKSQLSLDERNSYFNLILLCPTHHKLIDKGFEDYTIERLHFIKDQHELWVEQTLSERVDPKTTAADTIYVDLIDAAVDGCCLDQWESWTARLLSFERNCDSDFETGITDFAKKVLRTPWPGTLPELERSIKTLSKIMTDLMDKFGENFGKHIKLKGHVLTEIKPLLQEWNPSLYEERFEEREKWGEEIDSLVREATKAANWMADVVRRDINPMFFVTKGKFTFTYGPFEELRMKTVLAEYSDDEKKIMPYISKPRDGKVKK